MTSDQFNEAIAEVLDVEGGYVNDPDDPGGETIGGIARKYNPRWPGWSIIDEIKARGEVPQTSDVERELYEYYRIMYWDPVRCSDLQDDAVALVVFDTSVHMGTHRAAMYLQEALNLLNRDGRSWSEILEDGRIGSVTLSTLQRCLRERRGSEDLVLVIHTLRGMHYINRVRQKSSQEKYLRGWLRRINK